MNVKSDLEEKIITCFNALNEDLALISKQGSYIPEGSIPAVYRP